MGILAIAQVLHLVPLAAQGARKGRAFTRPLDGAEIAGDGAVVARRVCEGLGRELKPALGGDDTVLLQRLHESLVVCGVYQHAHALMVLGPGADHGGPADVDVLDGVVQRAARLRNRAFEGVEVDDEKVDGADAVHGHQIGIAVESPQQAAVDARMQGLDAAVHDFRKAGLLGHLDDRHAVAGEQLRRAAGRQDADAERRQPPRERHHAGLVGNADEGIAVGGHGRAPARSGDAAETGPEQP